MTYTHITTNELVLIESYYKESIPVSKVSKYLNRSRQTIYNVYQAFKEGLSTVDYYSRYKKNKKRCGRNYISLPKDEKDYIESKISQGWTPDVIVGRKEKNINCSSRTLYRMFIRGVFNREKLPMKGKRKPNGHKEKRGKQAFKRSIHTRCDDYKNFSTEFGHLEGDTIVGEHHKSAVITLVERKSKVIIALKPSGRQASDIEMCLNEWFSSLPKNIFKSITFDCGKEFSNWKSVSNTNDIDIYFADPGVPSQRGLNENSNGLLRKDGLPKRMDFNKVNQFYIESIASKRNNIPRKSLNYQTPLEVFLSYIDDEKLSNLI